MVQIITIKVEAKRRSKALKLAAATQGVQSVEFMNDEDGVIVKGDEVDAVCLTNYMRKKFGYAKLLSLQHVIPNEEGGNGNGNGNGNGGGESTEESSSCCPCNYNNCCQFPPPPCPNNITYVVDANPYPSICSIM